MPTISSSLVQPLVTPSTALFTSARTRPCTAPLESSSRVTCTCPSFCSSFTPAGRWLSTLPLGPCTVTTLPCTCTFTPWGTVIGFFPIRDIAKSFWFLNAIVWASCRSVLFLISALQLETRNRKLETASPHFAQQFAAHALLARLAPGHHAFGRGEDVDAQPAQHARNLVAAHVDAASRPRDAVQVGDRALVVAAVFQVHAQNLVSLFLHRLEAGDVALFLEDAGQLQLQLGGGNIQFGVTGVDRIANARQKICHRIG